MFHGKPWHFVAFFVLMPVAVLVSNALGLGTNGLFIAILTTAALVVAGAFLVKKVRGVFRSRDEAAAFLLGGPEVPVLYQPVSAPFAVTETAPDEGIDTIEGEIQEEHFLEAPEMIPSLQLPAQLRPEYRYRLYLGSHTLDLVNAYEHLFILEALHPGTNTVTRVLAEELGRLHVPFLLVDLAESFHTLLSELPFGRLLGSPSAQQTLPQKVQHHAYPVDREWAWTVGQTVLQEGWQVVFRFGSYASPCEATEVLLSLLQGMQQWQMHQARQGNPAHPCVIVLNEAWRFLPSDYQQSVAKDEHQLAQRLRTHLLAYLKAKGAYGMHIYLVSRRVTGMNREALSLCRLWLLKQPPAAELSLLSMLTGLLPEHLMRTPSHQVLLIDSNTGEATPITFRESSSIHEEEHLPPWCYPALVLPPLPVSPSLASSVFAPLPMAGEATAAEAEGEPGETGYPPPLAGFTAEELAWASTLLRTRWGTVHAIKDAPVAMREQARALGLVPLANGDLFRHEKAVRLHRVVSKLSSAERAPYVALARERLRQWQVAHGGEEPVDERVTIATGPPEGPLARSATGRWRLPLLDDVLPQHKGTVHQGEIDQDLQKEELARTVRQSLRSFRVEAEVRKEDISIGPTIIRLGIRPTGKPVMKPEKLGSSRMVPVRDEKGEIVYETRTKVKRIMELQNDLALVLQATSIRMDAPVPGYPFVGVEIPNKNNRLVTLREVVDSDVYRAAKVQSPVVIGLGKDVAGRVRIGDLARMPHLLIAGTTGSGKSVLVNVIIACILTQATPDDVRLVLIDPKKVELSLYHGIAHLLAPVVTEVEQVVPLLQQAISEMERRYRLFSALGVRNLGGYRTFRAEQLAKGKGMTELEHLPYIVIIIDELADLMMVAPEEVEGMMCRLTQLARATGIHLVVATQRPSVDVITGLIKANIPTRISFMVSSAVDSRTIIDTGGAEHLLGRGDMLYLAADAGRPERIQGAFLTDAEVERLADYWRCQQLLHSPDTSLHPVSTEGGGQSLQHSMWDVSVGREGDEESEGQGQGAAKRSPLSEAELFEHLKAYLLYGTVCEDGTPIPVRLHKLPLEDRVLVAEAVTWRGYRGSAITFESKLRTKRGAMLRDLLIERGLMDRTSQQPILPSDRLTPLLIGCGLIDPQTRQRIKPLAREAPSNQEHEASPAQEASFPPA